MMTSRVARYFLVGCALVAGLFSFGLPSVAHAQAAVDVTAGYAPPAIPTYDQPPCPGDGYLWTPGYWAWGPGGYYWVDGAWVLPPYVGALWTPGYWGWGGGFYSWYPGYWGRTIGYYGGINYGFGYFGVGFYGGYWNGGRFFYNRAYGNFGAGFRGNFYSRSYAGLSSRPGGVSYASRVGYRGNATGNFRGGQSFAGHSTVNGQAFSGRSNYGSQSFAGRSTAAQSYNRSSYGSVQTGRSYSAPATRSYGGGGYAGGSTHAMSGGGGFHGGGGGGSFHGGGGRR